MPYNACLVCLCCLCRVRPVLCPSPLLPVSPSPCVRVYFPYPSSPSPPTVPIQTCLNERSKQRQCA
eukprot:XP_001697101.1 predicted protein [Chlamydomonas reinhardtii]